MPPLTNGHTTVRSTEVGRSLGNSSHSKMVKCASEKSGKCTWKSDGTSTSSTSHGNTNHVLFSNKAFNMPFRKFILVVKGVGGVFCVSIQGNDTLTGFSKLYKAIGIGPTNCNLQQVENKEIKRALPWIIWF